MAIAQVLSIATGSNALSSLTFRFRRGAKGGKRGRDVQLGVAERWGEGLSVQVHPGCSKIVAAVMLVEELPGVACRI